MSGSTFGGAPDGFWWLAGALWVVLSYRRYKRIKNRWRMWNPPSVFANLSPVSPDVRCPRCEAPWPSGYEPRTHKEMMWKGIVCPNCGCEYDQRGHERRD